MRPFPRATITSIAHSRDCTARKAATCTRQRRNSQVVHPTDTLGVFRLQGILAMRPPPHARRISPSPSPSPQQDDKRTCKSTTLEMHYRDTVLRCAPPPTSPPKSYNYFEPALAKKKRSDWKPAFAFCGINAPFPRHAVYLSVRALSECEVKSQPRQHPYHDYTPLPRRNVCPTATDPVLNTQRPVG